MEKKHWHSKKALYREGFIQQKFPDELGLFIKPNVVDHHRKSSISAVDPPFESRKSKRFINNSIEPCDPTN